MKFDLYVYDALCKDHTLTNTNGSLYEVWAVSFHEKEN